MNDFTFFMPIAKLDRDRRTVSGYASTPTKDSDGEIVTLEAVKAALPDYMNWRNIREMHALKAVGTAEEANMDSRGLYLTAKIVDDNAWQKCVEGVYKGFSIGGRKLAKTGDKITKLEMTEISVVDRPANPDCRINIAKRAKDSLDAEGYLVKAKEPLSPEAKALAKMAKVVEKLAKAGPPAAHDGFSLPARVEKDNASPKDDSVENNKTSGPTPCEKHGKVNCTICDPKCAADDGGSDDSDKTQKREFSDKERQSLASSGKALPDGSYPIENLQDLRNAIQAIGRAKNPGKAKRHIKNRARALNATGELPEEWGKNKSAKKLAKAELNRVLGLGIPSFLTLKPSASVAKGMRTAGQLSHCFDSLRDAQRSLMLEGHQEGGDKKDHALAAELGEIAHKLATLIGQKSTHEASEARDMSDADDKWVNGLIGGEDKMATAKSNGAAAAAAVSDSHGDPLTDAVAALMKRAAAPTRGQRLNMAKADMKECRKAMKECRKAIEECHKMHKGAFLAKARKTDGKDDAKDDEFDHAGAMEKLQKAYGQIAKARTFGKAAIGNIAKAQSVAGRSGQRGEEVSDAEGKFFEVPPGIRDLSPRDMASASPGGASAASIPPMYPDDGSVYPGKAVGGGDLAKYAKDGQIPADVVELIMAKAKAEGELDALKRLPTVPSGGRRPYTFDMTKVTGGASATPQELSKTLFDGVNPNALNGTDERAHTEASARVIGNLITSGQFGKSVFDPAFKGAAGSSR